MTSMPSIWVRSVPVMRNKSARKPNCGTRVLHDEVSRCRESWLAGKQFLNGLHGIEETIRLRGKRAEIVA
jgi:hypothetical protein